MAVWVRVRKNIRRSFKGKRNIFKSNVFFLCTFAVLAVCNTAEKRSEIEPYARFMAGCLLLQKVHKAPNAPEQASRYCWLEAVTGVKAESMLAFLEVLRENPQKAKIFNEIMQQINSKQNN